MTSAIGDGWCRCGWIYLGKGFGASGPRLELSRDMFLVSWQKNYLGGHK